MTNPHRQLADQVLQLANKLIFLEKKILLTHGDLKLYPSEIHLLDVIDRETGINATEIAARLGVTKGAVSQTLTRLEKKGVVSRAKTSNHKNEVTVSFTQLGNEAFENHRQTRALIAERFAGYMADVSAKEQKVIHKFLNKLQDFFGGME